MKSFKKIFYYGVRSLRLHLPSELEEKMGQP